MKVKAKQAESTDISAPRPVHPRAVRSHGLFGEVFVKQHMMIDDLWTPNSVKDQLKRMSKLLARRLDFSQLEKEARKKKIVMVSRDLRRECRDGRSRLQRLMSGDTQAVRNLLSDHKDMQRLYQQMPAHLVVDNINQRTFVMRKERDRLECRLDQLKKAYGEKLLEMGQVHNRIQYENEFMLDEEIHGWDLERKIENVQTRLSAVKTIKDTYRKIVEILRHDELFYEPILRSLDRDIQDQGDFIKHILYLGSPALVRFQELGEEFRMLDDKTRKSIHSSIQQCSAFRKYDVRPVPPTKEPKGESEMYLRIERRYERETRSMLQLKHELEQIEETIKKIKFATLCTQEKEVYPRIKNQVDSNHKLQHKIDKDILGHETLEIKMKYASVWQAVLKHNLDEDEVESLEKIKYLEESIKAEDVFQEQTLAHIKNRSDIFVLLRFALWNIHETMRHVAPKRMHQSKYPNIYLKLPLLRYEMLDMKACPPDPFVENVPSLLQTVTHNLKLLQEALGTTTRQSTVRHHEAYCHEMLETMANLDMESQVIEPRSAQEADVSLELKALQNVPDRRQIKLVSARFVEKMMRKDG